MTINDSQSLSTIINDNHYKQKIQDLSSPKEFELQLNSPGFFYCH